MNYICIIRIIFYPILFLSGVTMLTKGMLTLNESTICDGYITDSYTDVMNNKRICTIYMYCGGTIVTTHIDLPRYNETCPLPRTYFPSTQCLQFIDKLSDCSNRAPENMYILAGSILLCMTVFIPIIDCVIEDVCSRIRARHLSRSIESGTLQPTSQLEISTSSVTGDKVVLGIKDDHTVVVIQNP